MAGRLRHIPAPLTRLKARIRQSLAYGSGFPSQKKPKAGKESTAPSTGPVPGADPPLLVEQTSCGKEQGGNDTADDPMSRQEDQPGVICAISTEEEGQNHVAMATGDRTETRTNLSNKCSQDQSSHESDEHVNGINHQQQFWTDSPSDHLFQLGEGLWNDAYHSLKIDEPELVSLYEEIMHQCWTPNSPSSSITSLPHSAEAVDNILEDNSKPLWAEQAKFLEVWMAEKDDPGRRCDKPFNAKQMIILFKDIVRPSALSMTGSAVPWVAACLAAKSLFRHGVISGPVALGFIELLSKIDGLRRLSLLLPGETANTSDITKSGQNRARDALVSLYAAVLLYIVRIACSTTDRNMIVEPGVIDQLSDRTRQMEGAFTASFDNKIGNELRDLFSQAEHAEHASTPFGGSENDNDKLPSNLVLSFEDAEEMLQKACHDEKLPEHLLKWILSTQEYCKFCRTENTDENRLLCVSG